MPILGSSASGAKSSPVAPTIGTATDAGSGRAYNNGAATVTFTAPTSKLPITSYTVTSSPGGYTGTGASSPITVAGLQSATAYTFTVTATSSAGTSAASSASNSITATTVPQAPTIGSATAGNASATVAYTAGANGGAAVSTFTATSSPSSITGTGASPITVSGLSNGTAYTFTVTATNANGTSTASSASNSVTPAIPTDFESIATATPSGTSSVTFSSISSAYKSLQIRAITKSGQTSAADYTDILIALNGTALTKSHMVSGDGTSVSASNSTQSIGRTINNHSSLVNNFNPIIIDIIDYASTTKNKTVRSISGLDGNAYPRTITNSSAFLNSTSAVTSITLSTASATNWIAGTTFALYGSK